VSQTRSSCCVKRPGPRPRERKDFFFNSGFNFSCVGTDRSVHILENAFQWPEVFDLSHPTYPNMAPFEKRVLPQRCSHICRRNLKHMAHGTGLMQTSAWKENEAKDDTRMLKCF